jgi:hypothetical protein
MWFIFTLRRGKKILISDTHIYIICGHNKIQYIHNSVAYLSQSMYGGCKGDVLHSGPMLTVY